MGGSLSFDTPMLWSIGFLVTFLFGGLTGVILASPPLDFHVSDSYFVVAHFHYVVFGTVVFAMFAGFYFWWPKMTGRMLDERLGKLHFWLLFVGFHTTFLVQHWLGVEGMPRRYADYLPEDGFTTLNQISTVGSFLLAASTLPFLLNVYLSAKAPKVVVDDPWGWGRSLEWATSCPPPRHNFHTLPRIRSESPAFDLHHPEIALLELADNDAERDGEVADAPEVHGREEMLRDRADLPVDAPTRRGTDEGRGMDLRDHHRVRGGGGSRLLVPLRGLDRHLRAGDDRAAHRDDHPLPRVPRLAHGPAAGGPQGGRDRRRGR